MRNSKCKTVTLLAGMIGLAVLPAFSNTNVLFDDFNDGNFAGWTVDLGSWRVTNSTLVGVGEGYGIDGWIYTGQSNWSDIVFEADILFQTGEAEIAFRSTGQWENEYRFLLWSQAPAADLYTNSFALREYNDGVLTLHTESLPNIHGNVWSPVPITDTVHVKIEAVGSLLSFYVNDGLIYQFDDPTPIEAGQVGVGVIWNWTAAFDNVSVTLVPEPHAVPFFIGASLLLAGLHLRRKRLSRDPKEPSGN